jgi:hypothetical protein
MGSGERAGKRASFSGASGSSDIEGKAAMGSGERAGKRASFNGAGGSSDIEASEPDWHLAEVGALGYNSAVIDRRYS